MIKFRPTSLLLTALLSCSLSLSAAESMPTQEDVTAAGYIRDNLFIYMHAGAGKRFRILGSVNAGTPVEKLEEDIESGYIKVKDDKGRIGWVEAINFTEQSGVSVQLAELQTEYDQLKQELLNAQSVADQAVQELEGNRQSADHFHKTIASLEQDKLQLQAKIDKLEGQKTQKTLMYGAGILFGGLIFGLILPSIMPRRRRQDNWV